MKEILEENMTGVNAEGNYPNTPLRVLTAKSIIGDKVHNMNDEYLGDIKDIMINIIDGTIEYYVIEFGSWLSLNKKYFAIPFDMLKVDAERQLFLFDQPKSALENAPGFDKSHWPETNIHYYDYDSNANWTFW
ncbi:PRC-barrel domain-containing protein [Ferruginibacter sp. SUN002]|uniref:PRC-barrel domain-containing protein n=1 Tax=Ferruginibacter sp. SUN002 TaxID=2937789 RepID=UPI003D36B969